MLVDYWVTVVDHWDKISSDISQQVPHSCEEPKSLSWNSRAFCTYGMDRNGNTRCTPWLLLCNAVSVLTSPVDRESVTTFKGFPNA